MDNEKKIEIYNAMWDEIHMEKVTEMLPVQMDSENVHYRYDDVYIRYIVSLVRDAANDNESIATTIRTVINNEFDRRRTMLADLEKLTQYRKNHYSDENLQDVITKVEKRAFALKRKRNIASLMSRALDEADDEILLDGLNPDQIEAAYRKRQKETLAESARSHLTAYLYEHSMEVIDEDFTLSEIVNNFIRNQDCNISEEDMWDQIIDDYFYDLSHDTI